MPTERSERAFQDYLALGEGRSLEKLLAVYQVGPKGVPTLSLRTLKKWSQRDDWQRRTNEHVATVNKEALSLLQTDVAGERVRDIDLIRKAIVKVERTIADPKSPADVKDLAKLIETKFKLLGSPLADRHELAGVEGSPALVVEKLADDDEGAGGWEGIDEEGDAEEPPAVDDEDDEDGKTEWDEDDEEGDDPEPEEEDDTRGLESTEGDEPEEE